MVNLCGELFCASLPRPKHGVVAPNLGDDSGRHEDHGTTEITERKTRRNPKEGTMMEVDQSNRITERILGAAIEVHRALGPGLLEPTYHACLAHELRQQGLEVEREKVLPVVSKGVTLDCGYRIDLLVEHTVIVELKAVQELTAIPEAEILSYLKLSGCPVWSPDQFQRPAVDGGDQTIPDLNGRLSRTCVEFSR